MYRQSEISPPYVLAVWWTSAQKQLRSIGEFGAPQQISTGFTSRLNSLLHQRRSTEVNQTLHYIWPSFRLLHYVCIIAGSCPLTEICQVQNSLCVQVLCSAILEAWLDGARLLGQLNSATTVYGDCHCSLLQAGRYYTVVHKKRGSTFVIITLQQELSSCWDGLQYTWAEKWGSAVSLFWEGERGGV